MTKDDKEIVSALQDALAGKVGKKRYDLWFGTSTRLSFDGRALRIGVPNQCFLDWIRGNFRRQIVEACEDVLGCCPAIDFHLDNDNANPVHQANISAHLKKTCIQQENDSLRQEASR